MQRIWPHFTALAVSVLMGAYAHASTPYLVDQRDPEYQKAVEHLAQASQALSVAQRELKAAEASHPLPGLNVSQMRDQLNPVEDTLRVLLSPERKRQTHQTAVPDGIFFNPVQIGE